MINVKTMTTADIESMMKSAEENNLDILRRLCSVELGRRQESNHKGVIMAKTGPKPRKRIEGAKLNMLPIECTQTEKDALLAALNDKLGGNIRTRFEFLINVANNIDTITELLKGTTNE